MRKAFGRGVTFAYGAIRGLRNIGGVVLLTMTAGHAQTVTIAALGDSLTAGYGLDQGQGLVPQLEQWLRDQGADVTMINAGVSGDTTAGGLARVGWTLTPQVDAMIVALGGNDYLRGLDPAVSRTNLDGILAAGQQAGVAMLLVGLQVGANYGPAYKRDFEANYTDLAASYDVPLYHDMFAGMRVTDSDLPAFMQADGIHPSAEGVALIVADIGPAILDLIADVPR
ncbi:arylesterase [Yoonia vestfoldensis]|uniref:Lipolytic enzyme, G-D-S-L family n=1 Tax=Yoonia vestfoldensis SKA53 TaxID=314232 RepID=A3V0S5_9RHOB|nr:arylesterase [Yoonia vestfoldensis]EAQ07842.1 Lipolytic enzyme, G-D-S-L family [Yoonia vestfoldensis SKA53]